ncbi:MAG: SUMF1/EgtB/PvdO family nonheme iron enzyme [Tepidisphaeraceae bacterium]
MRKFLSTIMMQAAMLMPVAGIALAQDANLPQAEDKIPGVTATFKMRQVPAGKITIKDKDGKDKEVAVKSFWIQETEATWDIFDTWAFRLDLTAEQKIKGVDAETRPSPPYAPPDRGFGHEGYPAISMAYEGVIHYINWLNKKTGKKYRLPTEAEWEYAARSGGAPIEKLTKEQLDEIAWTAENSNEKTQPVGKKKPSKWGLYDMLGNVGEFVQSEEEDVKVIKGGSFKDPASKISTKFREQWGPDWQQRDPQDPKSKWWMSDAPFAGFRLVRDE